MKNKRKKLTTFSESIAYRKITKPYLIFLREELLKQMISTLREKEILHLKNITLKINFKKGKHYDPRYKTESYVCTVIPENYKEENVLIELLKEEVKRHHEEPQDYGLPIEVCECGWCERVKKVLEKKA